MSEYEPTPADDPAVGLSFLEKLVLAIIDAHPTKGDTHGYDRDKRLRTAMHALAPPYYRHGKSGHNDQFVLLWMANEEYKKLCSIRIKKMGREKDALDIKFVPFESSRDLARHAYSQFGRKIRASEMANEKSLISRLSDQYEKQRSQLIDTVRYMEDGPHGWEHQQLIKIEKAAAAAGLKMKVPEEPTAF